MRSWAIVLVWLLVAPLGAQRTTAWAQTTVQALLDLRSPVRGDDGARSWEDFQASACELCDGEKVTPCRACRGGEHGAAKNCAECRGRARVPCERCAGEGEALDPFLEMPCPSCGARARIPCRICLGVGRWDVVGGGTPSCVPCGARGGHRCSTCKGARYIGMLRTDGTPLHEATAEQLEALRETLAQLEVQCDAFTALAKRTRPRPPSPDELIEPFTELCVAAAKIDRVWRREPRTLDAIVASLRKDRAGGTFTTRRLDHPTTIRLEYRRAAEGLGVWIDYHLAAIAKCATLR